MRTVSGSYEQPTHTLKYAPQEKHTQWKTGELLIHWKKLLNDFT